MKDVKQRILIITYNYLPLRNPRAYRWSSLVNYLADHGYKIDIVAAWNQSFAEWEEMNSVNIFRTGKSFLQSLRNPEKTPSSNVKSKTSLVTKIIGLCKGLYRKIYWPDYAFLWYFSAHKKAKDLLEKDRYDCIITVSHPFTSHLVGLALKKKYPEINWLVDIGDPFYFADSTPLNNYMIYRKLNYYYENKILDLANRISVTTRSTMDKYIEDFPCSAPKIHVIPPLITVSSESDSVKSLLLPKNDKIRLVFVGTLYKEIRNPEYLLRLFMHLVDNYKSAFNFELHFIGHYNDCLNEFAKYSDLINKQIYVHGLIEHEEALAAMRQADILVNIGNSTKYQLPSKVVEYALLCKPILNIIKSKEDSSLEFYRYYPSIFNISSEEWPQDEIITDFYNFICNPPKVNKEEVASWLKAYRIESIAASYLALIK